MNTDNELLLEALKKQIEALQSRIKAYIIQNEALTMHNEALTIQLGDYIVLLEDSVKQVKDLEIRVEDSVRQVKDLEVRVEDLTYNINKANVDKKILSEKEKVFNYLLEKVKSVYPKRKTQAGTYKWIVKLAEYMLENETINSSDIKSHFGITRNTQWRYLQYIRPLGYFKYTFKNHIPVFTITEQGKAAKEEIQQL
jgi:hypothetical protein